MKIEEFKNLPYGHFNPSENWGDLSKVSFELVKALDEFREIFDNSVYISPNKYAVYAPNIGHAENSIHYLGMAADVFPKGSLMKAFIMANQIPKIGGIGVYPYWKWKSKKLFGGLHIDVRSYGKRRALWWQDKNEKYRGFIDLKDINDFFDAIYEQQEIIRSFS